MQVSYGDATGKRCGILPSPKSINELNKEIKRFTKIHKSGLKTPF
jgi:hypothetical protein